MCLQEAITLLCLINIGTLGQVPGCPMEGCKPTGSFAYEDDVFPLGKVGVVWSGEWSQMGFTGGRGCTGNQYNIVCPVLRFSCIGFLSLKPKTGEMKWLNGILRHPVLPIMDVMGNIIGADGFELADILVNGTVLEPVIDFTPVLAPIYSLNIADDNIFLIASLGNGRLVTYFTDGIPHASMWLTDTVANLTGVWLPIATPVINGNRAYILTVFKPDNATTPMYGKQRLYATDLRDVAVNRIDIQWHFDFEPSTKMASPYNHLFPGADHRTNGNPKLNEVNGIPFQVLTYDKYVFALIPLSSPGGISPVAQPVPLLWILEDTGTKAVVRKAVVPFPAKQIAINDNVLTFPDSSQRNKTKFSGYHTKFRTMADDFAPLLWGASGAFDGIWGVNITTGKIVRWYNLSLHFNTQVNITSKLMISGQPGDDILYMGINLKNKTQQLRKVCEKLGVSGDNHNYLIALNSSSVDIDILWMVPSVDDGVIIGQIVGTPLLDDAPPSLDDAPPSLDDAPPSQDPNINESYDQMKSDILVAYSQKGVLGTIWAVAEQKSIV